MIAVVTVIASLAALLVAAPAGDATFRGHDGNLLWFFSGEAGRPALWLTGGRGQKAHSLPIRTPKFGFAGASAVFTRTGRQLIFQKYLSFDQLAVMLVNRNGTGVTMLAVLPTNDSLALSPDGRTLAGGYLAGPPPGRHAEFINIYTDAVTLPIMVRDAAIGPTWLSGQTLLWIMYSGVVETTDTNGRHAHRINIRLPGTTPQSQITIQSVVPSPDGTRLAVTAGPSPCGLVSPSIKFSTLPPCTTDIYLVGARGGKAKRLTHSGAASAPVWSPDGREIAFHDGTMNKLLTIAGGRVRTLAPRIPFGGLEVVDWQAVP